MHGHWHPLYHSTGMDNMLNGEGHTSEPYIDVNYTSGIDLSNVYYVPRQGEA
jgi:hypothetical protein